MPLDEVAKRYSWRQTKIAYHAATMGWWRDHFPGEQEPDWAGMFVDETEHKTEFLSALEQQKALAAKYWPDKAAKERGGN